MQAKSRSLWRRENLLAAAGLLLALAVWEGLAHAVKLSSKHAESIMPTIEYIFAVSLPNLAGYYGMGGLGVGKYGAEPGYGLAFVVLAYHSYCTLFRIVCGFALGGFLGIGLGLLLKANRELNSFFGTPVLSARIIPQMALVPLFIIWFGGSSLGFVLFIAFGVFSGLFINTQNAVDNVPVLYQRYAMTLGAGSSRLYRTVILPALVPELLGGIRVIVGQAWALSLAAEFLASQNGLGRIIIQARQRLDTGQIVIILLLYMAFSILMVKAITAIGAYLTRWKPVWEHS